MGRQGVAKIKQTTLPAKHRPKFLDDMDGRLEVVKALKTARNRILDDLGGRDELSAIQVSLVDRFVFNIGILQTLESDFVAGKKTKYLVTKWVQLTNTLQGLASKLGLQRVPKSVINLSTYLEAKRS